MLAETADALAEKVEMPDEMSDAAFQKSELPLKHFQPCSEVFCKRKHFRNMFPAPQGGISSNIALRKRKPFYNFENCFKSDCFCQSTLA
jgi:hypothetical protein